MKETLTQRVERLERELETLRAAPVTHIHHHYPPALPLPLTPSPWQRPYPDTSQPFIHTGGSPSAPGQFWNLTATDVSH